MGEKYGIPYNEVTRDNLLSKTKELPNPRMARKEHNAIIRDLIEFGFKPEDKVNKERAPLDQWLADHYHIGSGRSATTEDQLDEENLKREWWSYSGPARGV